MIVYLGRVPAKLLQVADSWIPTTSLSCLKENKYKIQRYCTDIIFFFPHYSIWICWQLLKLFSYILLAFTL